MLYQRMETEASRSSVHMAISPSSSAAHTVKTPIAATGHPVRGAAAAFVWFLRAGLGEVLMSMAFTMSLEGEGEGEEPVLLAALLQSCPAGSLLAQSVLAGRPPSKMRSQHAQGVSPTRPVEVALASSASARHEGLYLMSEG
jgi:hypothetical protein